MTKQHLSYMLGIVLSMAPQAYPYTTTKFQEPVVKNEASTIDSSISSNIRKLEKIVSSFDKKEYRNKLLNLGVTVEGTDRYIRKDISFRNNDSITYTINLLKYYDKSKFSDITIEIDEPPTLKESERDGEYARGNEYKIKSGLNGNFRPIVTAYMESSKSHPYIILSLEKSLIDVRRKAGQHLENLLKILDNKQQKN